MDHSPARPPWLEIFIILFTIVFLFVAFKVVVLHNDDEEKAVHFRVPVPEQCSSDWKGELLEKPVVKVTSLLDMAVKKLLRVTDSGFECHKMLLPGQWPIIGTCEPLHAGQD